MAYFVTANDNTAILGAGNTEEEALKEAMETFDDMTDADAIYMECTEKALTANNEGVSDWTEFKENEDGLLDWIEE